MFLNQPFHHNIIYRNPHIKAVISREAAMRRNKFWYIDTVLLFLLLFLTTVTYTQGQRFTSTANRTPAQKVNSTSKAKTDTVLTLWNVEKSGELTLIDMESNLLFAPIPDKRSGPKMDTIFNQAGAGSMPVHRPGNSGSLLIKQADTLGNPMIRIKKAEELEKKN